MRHSLRLRLLIAVVSLLALACLAVGVVSSLALQHFLIDRLDSQLMAAGSRTSAADGRGDRDRPDAGGDQFLLAAAQTAGTLGVRIVDGSVTAASELEPDGRTEDLSAASSAVLASVPTGAAPRTVDVPERGPFRVVASVSANGDVLVTALPLKDVEDAVQRLVAVEAGVSLLVLAVTSMGGALIIRRTLRPLDRVAELATRVTDLPLARGEVEIAERVPARDTDPRTEVGQVGTALNLLLDHVSSALAARQESETRVRRFVADASHELRTPLASIRGYAELHRRNPEPVPADVAAALDRIEAEARRMTELVEDLLLLARLDAGRPLAQEVVDLSALLVDAISDATVLGSDHVWRLVLPEDPICVLGDEPRLQQVIVNLLANARTHTPRGTTVTATAGLDTGHRAILTIADDGPGIPPELLPQVFVRFTRGDRGRSRAAGSTGLGLAIVESIVTAHQGYITVTSRPGQTHFSVRLPRAADS